MTHIYVIAAREEGPVKIGITTNLQARRKQLQTGYHEELIIWSGWGAPEDARGTEAMIHAHFADRRLKGEWFNITVREAEDFIGRSYTSHTQPLGVG